MEVQQVQIFRLDVRSQFDGLTSREQRYAHHMARAAWHGARIVMRQVSPESLPIFDFIIELYKFSSGEWHRLVDDSVENEELQRFLIYAATFLSNLGNYYGSGDQKFIPGISAQSLQHLSKKSPRLSELHDQFSGAIYSVPPFGLGYPSNTNQSSYYPGKQAITESEISMISRLLEENSIFPENTRIQKAENGSDFEVLIASTQHGQFHVPLQLPNGQGTVHLLKGDHAADLEHICAELTEAAKHVANDQQREFLAAYVESFTTGSLGAYRDSLHGWVKDRAPRVENIFGFVEPYRDPYGTRAEFEGLVAITDADETRLLGKLVDESAKFIRRLPWAGPENDGKGVFEKSLFEPPDLSSIYTLAYCSSIIFPGINLPNYNDIRQDTGFKNVIVANRMATESQAKGYPFIDAFEAETFQKHKFPAYYWWVVLHELLGHGTGRMMVEEAKGVYNFDHGNPPINPLTGQPIQSWYKFGQTWTGQFGDLATTVDECRAELVGAYLMDDKELLAIFGISDTSDITASDITYNMYQQLGVDGLRGLANYNADSQKWGQAHSRAHFSILKWLLIDGGGFMTIDHNKKANTLTVRVNRSKIISHGKPSLGRMLLRLHMYRCTADVKACREYYEMLSSVEEQQMEWRKVVLTNKPPSLVFVHANTFVSVDDKDNVIVKEYEPTADGIIQSWAERGV